MALNTNLTSEMPYRTRFLRSSKMGLTRKSMENRNFEVRLATKRLIAWNRVSAHNHTTMEDEEQHLVHLLEKFFLPGHVRSRSYDVINVDVNM